MSEKFNIEEAAKSAVLSANLEVRSVKFGYLPNYDVLRRDTQLCSAYWGVVEDPTEGTAHVVVVAYTVEDDQETFRMACKDRFLEGLLDNDSKAQRIQSVVSSLPLDKADSIRDLLEEAYGTCESSAACDFWSKWRTGCQLCKHTEGFLAHLRDTVPDFKQSMRTHYQEAFSVSSDALTKDGVVQLSHLAFKVPVLLEGDRGSRKTHESRSFARKHGYPLVEVGGHEGIESIDLLGCLIPYSGKETVWKDGPLSEAFRRAQSEKTVLLIDELLRIPTRQLSILLTALSPDEGTYKLRTGRVIAVNNGVATEEVLVCPVSNLAVIATTNVGSEYAVDDCDPALAERFIVLRRDTTEEMLSSVLSEVAGNLGLPAKLVDQCVSFFRMCKEIKYSGQLAHEPTTRTMCRLLELVNIGAKPWMAVQTLSLLWVSRNADGKPNQEQLRLLEKIGKDTFK